MYNQFSVAYHFFAILMKLFKRFVLLLLFIGSTINANTVENIKINGLDSISRGTVLSYLPIEIGDEFNERIGNLTIQELYKTDFFKDINISFNKSTRELKVNLIENPSIKYVDFLNYSDNDVLNDKIIELLKENSDFKIGKIFTNKNLNKLTKELKDLYLLVLLRLMEK